MHHPSHLSRQLSQSTKHHRVTEVKYTKSHHQSLILLSALCCSTQSMIIMINAFCLLFSNLNSSYKRVLLVSANRRHRFVRFVTGWGNAYLDQDACDLSLPFPPSKKYQPVGISFPVCQKLSLGFGSVGSRN